jgi:N-carbamoylputrescine amidase
MPEVTVAAVQFARRMGDKHYNIGRARELVAHAADRGATLIGLPELFSTGYFPGAEKLSNEYFEWAEQIPGPATDAIAELAAERGIFVVAPIYEFEPRRRLYFNAAALIGPEGLIGVYRKRHIPAIPGMVEKFYFSPGDLRYPVYDAGDLRVGMSICYDRHFPETFRHLAIRGADIVFSVNNTPTPRSKRMWFPEIQVHASSNGVFVVQVNATPEQELPFFGLSAVIDPVGEVIHQLDDQEGALVTTIDTDAIASARLHYGGIRDTRMSDFAFGDEEPVLA